MNAVGTKTIETERLILRKMQKKDAELIYKNWTSDENVSKYVTWDTHKSVKDTKKYVHNAHYSPLCRRTICWQRHQIFVQTT